MKTRMCAVLILGLGLVVGCSGVNNTANPDAARDALGAPDTRALPDTLDAREIGDTPISSNGDATVARDAAGDGTSAPDTQGTPDRTQAPDTGAREINPSCPAPDGGAPYPFYCGRGIIGSICEDLLYPPECIAGEWTCGTTDYGRPWPRQDQCTCFGPVPRGPGGHCECIGRVYRCTSDGGTPDAADSATSG
jgi:hypothetical protein